MSARLFALAALATLAGCGDDFEQGGQAVAIVQRDPVNHCRLIITGRWGTIPPMTATIDGCEPQGGGENKDSGEDGPCRY